jgi:hypothetical protein
VSTELIDYWSAFAQKLEPGAASLAPVWQPAFRWQNNNTFSRLVFQPNATKWMEPVDAEEQARCDFWDSLVGQSG